MKKYHHSFQNLGQIASKATSLLETSQKRRSVRDFSTEPVDQQIIENLILTAATAPSGANMQPWTFCAVSDPVIKQKIREAAEKEEKEGYQNRMNEEWLKDLEPFETNWQKPFLEDAPWLIIVFKQSYGQKSDGGKKQHYYVNESVGIACGLLINAIHQCGLVTLTHTPSPMNFLSQVLNRPSNEKPFLLLPVGYPAENAMVPEIPKKTKDELIVWY
ncbi:nitroreductase family protein [Jiulongibacter sediminis]|uniref:Nitroreductase n=1 Tax=Jiulongibacter sediminis TaxID=1605367 RepID=A0A0N8H9U8_9BACT|nr:nitroreductase family protein [Jiulongibacter sediminis]KPM48372.1 nitroreductase [Jiulongibacter sediminis]TBX24910.1 nitroreductase [Jiulongibacter sediminis]